MAAYEKFLWIELIGFDNSATDFGVDALLSRMSVKPGCISLLLWSTEIIHIYTDLTTDAPIGPQQCAYYARPHNEERQRQNWTRFQLRGLIQELHKHGIEVYLSVFDQIISPQYAEKHGFVKNEEWVDSHPEIFYILNNGQSAISICPLKHLADGTLYEDFFINQLSRLLYDYDFDGFHAADGFGHPRFPINQGDFSEDMIDQFSQDRSITVPPGETVVRTDWILTHVKDDWIEFHVVRQQQFLGKLVAMLNSIERKHLVNSTWTRDPFEARYRYGIDYRRLAAAGIKTFIVEAQAAVVEMEGWNKSTASMLDQARSMVLRMKACVPECKFIFLNCVKDGMEQYSVLRHAPPRFASDVYSVTNLFHEGKTLF